jgi:hypothetical protein
MELKLWHTIVSACGEVRNMLDGKPLAVTPEAQANEATIIVSHSVSVKGSLRSEIRAKLDELRGELAKVLSEREVYFVLFPLTIHYDELVLRRLPPNEQTAWPLLQSERFGINDGGDKFYSFADERLANPDTPPLVFEVLYFCLSDGFIGRYANDSARIAGYKSNLASRIPTPRTPAQLAQKRGGATVEGHAGSGWSNGGNGDKKHAHGDGAKPGLRAPGSADKKPARSRSRTDAGALWVGLFYATAAMVVILVPLVLVWLSNL